MFNIQESKKYLRLVQAVWGLMMEVGNGLIPMLIGDFFGWLITKPFSGDCDFQKKTI